jgi:putative oxidoreductase
MSQLKKWEALTLLLLRCGLAIVFIYHGYPKLSGSTERFVESFRTLGLPIYVAYIAGAIELFGGVALALGLLTRVAGLLLLFDMAAAIWKYNLKEGIYSVQQYELPLILGLASLVVAATGGGQFTLDRLIILRKRKKGEMPSFWKRG